MSDELPRSPLRAVVDWAPLATDDDYRAAEDEVDRLLKLKPAVGSVERQQMEHLMDLMKRYEVTYGRPDDPGFPWPEEE